MRRGGAQPRTSVPDRPLRTGTPRSALSRQPTGRHRSGLVAHGHPPDAADCRAVISVNWVYVGSAIGAFGTAVYLRDTLRGTTKPNRVTWLLWAVAPLLATVVELDEGVGLRTLPTF